MSLDLSVNIRVNNHSLTHNLTKLASHVPVGTQKRYTGSNSDDYEMYDLSLYDVLWHGDEHSIYTLSDIREYLIIALEYLNNNYEDLSQYNSENGWGNIDNVINVVSNLIKDCNIYDNDAYLEFCR